MIKAILTLLVLLTSSLSAISQNDSILRDSATIYLNLDTLKFYSISLSSQTSNNKSEYRVNNKKVSFKTYNKYKIVWDNIDLCTPCYFKTYDENDRLLWEGVQFTDCAVGEWIEYYPNGKIKVIGHYKENDTGNWDNLWDRGYCSVKEGLWTYFRQNGDTERTELYENGELIK